MNEVLSRFLIGLRNALGGAVATFFLQFEPLAQSGFPVGFSVPQDWETSANFLQRFQQSV
ncbi:hypothetical protein [Phenylobacterium sp.]|uniref:hypothetical protein n=1 Tax=Phenylobacterium sp. TaxID=1871053 RepID=UPI00260BBF35|nr:hypothetical protein [Phenylobacterium sp.]